MTTIRASEGRIPAAALNRVASGERVRVRLRGGGSIYLVPEEDLRRLEEIEDRRDARAARRALSEMKRRGGKPIPWAKVKEELGL